MPVQISGSIHQGMMSAVGMVHRRSEGQPGGQRNPHHIRPDESAVRVSHPSGMPNGPSYRPLLVGPYFRGEPAGR